MEQGEWVRVLNSLLQDMDGYYCMMRQNLKYIFQVFLIFLCLQSHIPIFDIFFLIHYSNEQKLAYSLLSFVMNFEYLQHSFSFHGVYATVLKSVETYTD